MHGADRAQQGCDQRPPTLTAYDAIEAGREFSVVVRDEGGTWVPVTPLRQPFHHASTIAWRDASALMDGQRETGRKLTVIATGLGRTALREDPRRHLWFATYEARVDCVRPVEP